MTTENTKNTEAATPETDAKASPHIGFYSCATVPADFARKLERERDEWYYKAHANVAFTLEARAERDEAREKWKEQNEALRTLAEHGGNEIQKLIKECDEARNKMADALQEVDLRTLDFERMKQERDEAREEVASLRLEAKYHDEADALRKLRERERNEARDKAERYRLEANALMLKVMEGAK